MIGAQLGSLFGRCPQALDAPHRRATGPGVISRRPGARFRSHRDRWQQNLICCSSLLTHNVLRGSQ
jgi:hypothetical protein